MRFLKILIFISILILPFFSFSQNNEEKPKIIQYSSKVLYVGEALGVDVKVLKEEVIFYHDSSTMYCDSAYYNTKDNFFDAFGNIKIIRPTATDTVFLYGDTLHYSGNDKLARVRQNVILIKDSLTLTTNKLDYKTDQNIAHYSENGTTVNGEDTLKSVFGYYYADQDEFFFKDKVIITNPQFKMFCDTLKHNTETKTSFFLGPTEIINDSNYIYCENGWYKHETDIAQFEKNAFFRNESKTVKGDSLYYDRNKAIAKAFDNVIINDSIEKVILSGNHGEYFERADSSLMTEKALFVKITEKKDSLFLHADTLRTFRDSITDVNDSLRKIIYVLAYRHAKLYKSDLQAKCDSISYSTKDSIIELFHSPVLWSDENQLTADSMKVITEKDEPKEFHLYNNSFVIAQSDTVRFNQILGKNMIGYIENKELTRVDVFEEGKVTYFAKDDLKRLIGVNKITCVNMNIYLKDKEVKKIWFYQKPVAVMYPPLIRDPASFKYPGFQWLSRFRPVNSKEIFVWEKEEK